MITVNITPMVGDVYQLDLPTRISYDHALDATISHINARPSTVSHADVAVHRYSDGEWIEMDNVCLMPSPVH